MKKLLSVALIVTVLSPLVLTADEMKFGKEITLDETTKLSAILADPEDWVGKKVRVEGEVVDVCKKMGCWMEIVGDEPEHKIQAKVQDGVIVFPLKAKGRTAVVEGEVEKLELSLEQTVAYLKHMAEEQGRSFDPASVKEPQTIYRIWVHGAVVK